MRTKTAGLAIGAVGTAATAAYAAWLVRGILEGFTMRFADDDFWEAPLGNGMQHFDDEYDDDDYDAYTMKFDPLPENLV